MILHHRACPYLVLLNGAQGLIGGLISNYWVQYVLSLWLSYWQNTQSWEGEGNGNPLQYSCLGNPMDRGDWWAAVHGMAKSQTRLSNFTFTFHFHTLEKEMATHSSILTWRIPGTEAWWAATCGVTQSQTRLTWLSSNLAFGLPRLR